ncbi:MAG: endonuclease Q family protein [Candidatus Micrarchaeia archaeon]
MKIFCDFHIHSKYSRATSENLNLDGIADGAKNKGINIVGTGDFTHPLWIDELKKKLKPAEEGLYEYKNMKFILTVEVSTIFREDGSVKKVHHILHAPSLEVAEQISEILSNYGSLSADGRPILSVDPAEMVEKISSIDENILIYPAHNWTPFYGCMGSQNGFNSIKECYKEEDKKIHALETGLSSDPKMNWRLSELDKYSLISSSDAHSAQNIGREMTVFELESLSYKALNDSIIKRKTKGKGIDMTIEYYPEEGKYHYDGHRNCNVSLSPEEAKKFNNICPVCGKPLVVGVLHRVNELADRPEGYIPKDAPRYAYAVPLIEVLSYITGKGKGTQRVKELYSKLINKYKSEVQVLLNENVEEINEIDNDLGKAIENMRSANVTLVPGYDGVFGVVDLLNRIKKPESIIWKQKRMSDYGKE